MNGAANILEILQRYYEDSIVTVLAVMCIIWYLLRAEKEKRRFVYGALLCLALLLNDAAYFLIQKLGEAETYYRFLWVVPVIVLAAGLLIEAEEKLQNRGKKLLLCMIGMLVLWMYGGNYLERFFKLPENVYQIPQRIIDICDIIDTERTPEESVVVLSEEAALYGVREYNAYILEPVAGDTATLLKMMKSDNSNLSGVFLKATIKAAQLNYIVVNNKYPAFCAALEHSGCTAVGKTEEYTVFNTNLEQALELFKRLDSNSLHTEISIGELEDVDAGLEEAYEFVYYPDNHISYYDEEIQENVHLLNDEAEFQTAAFGELVLCAIDTKSNQISEDTIKQLRQLLSSEKKVLLFLSNPIYQEGIVKTGESVLFGETITEADKHTSELITLIKESNTVVSVYACGEAYSKYLLNDHLLQCVCVTDSSLGAFISVR